MLLPHDLWGADGYPISRFPGDNGNWTDYDNFLTRVISDVRAAGITVADTPEVRQDWAQYYDKVSEADADAGRRLGTAEGPRQPFVVLQDAAAHDPSATVRVLMRKARLIGE